jgi:hypothetical protein
MSNTTTNNGHGEVKLPIYMDNHAIARKNRAAESPKESPPGSYLPRAWGLPKAGLRPRRTP